LCLFFAFCTYFVRVIKQVFGAHVQDWIVTFLYPKHTLLEEKVLYRTLKGSISAMYLEDPERFYTLWVLYRTLGFHTGPIEPFTKKNGSI